MTEESAAQADAGQNTDPVESVTGDEEKKREQAPLNEVKADVAPKPLAPTRLEPAESRYNTWRVISAHGVSINDLLRTSYWQHHTNRIRPGDEIRVECEDGSYVAWLYVQTVGPKDARVKQVRAIDLDPRSPDEFAIPQGYSIAWRGQISKWTALRTDTTKDEAGNAKQTVSILKEEFETRSAAQRWLASHISSLER